jgi:WD40 repeat protein/serine/threonine protein kinase/tetratricopeptide (TPR) repeat protein
MDHHHIAKVLDAGTTDTGRPYFVMELVKGIPITKYCDDHRLNPRERLELFVPVCLAIQHAHQKGIIHRDIKPSNVLVSLYDGRPVPKVIDFGVAKAIQQRLTERTMFTEVGQIIGTLEYMSPEQAELNQLDIDTRSDVYSLGVLLYELLTGSTPISQKQLRQAGFAEMLRAIREVEPPKPSTRINDSGETLATISAVRRTEPKKLGALVRGDLDWIVMKALEKDRTRRYESAAGFARDIQRYLSEEPVEACPPSSVYRLRKFVRRNKGPVLAVSLVFLALITAISGTSVGLARALSAEARAKTDRDLKQMALLETQQAQQNTERSRIKLHDTLSNTMVQNGLRHWDQNDPLTAAVWFAQALSLDQGDRQREPLHRIRLATSLRQAPRLAHLIGHEDGIVDLQQCADSRRSLVVTRTASNEGTSVISLSGVGVYDTQTGQSVLPPLNWPGHLLAAAISTDGSRLAISWLDMANRSAAAQVFDVETARPVSPALQHRSPPVCLAFSSSGKRLMTGTPRAGERNLAWAQVWDVESGTTIGPPLEHKSDVRMGVFSPDDNRLVTAARPGVTVWECETGKPVFPPILQAENMVAYSPDGQRLAVVMGSNAAQVWNAESGVAVSPLLQHAGTISSLAFSRDGSRVITASHDRSARVWDAATGYPLSPPLRHDGPVYSADLAADQRRIVTAGEDGIVQVWDSETGERAAPPLQHGGVARRALFAADSRRVIAGGDEGVFRIWDLATIAPLATLEHGKFIAWATFSPDGKRIATASHDGTARIWDAEFGMPLTPPLRTSKAVRYATFTADGRHLIAREHYFDPMGQGSSWAWDSKGEPAELKDVTSHANPRFTPDGKRRLDLVKTSSKSTGQATAVQLVNADTQEVLLPPLEHGGAVRFATFSPDGRRLVTAGIGGVRIWNSETGTHHVGPLEHEAWVKFAVFSSDGQRLITCSSDRTARIWDVLTGKLLAPPLVHGGAVNTACFSSDGRTVVTASDDRSARVWDARTGMALAPTLHHAQLVGHASFSPDGTRVVTAGLEGVASVWDISPSQLSAEELGQLANLLAGRRLDERESLTRLDRRQLETSWQQLGMGRRSVVNVTSTEIATWHRREGRALVQSTIFASSSGNSARLNLWRAAELHYHQSLSVGPARWRDYLGRGMARANQGRVADAADDLDRAIELGADHWTAWHVRGQTRQSLGQWDEAASDFAVAVERGADNPCQVRRWHALSLLAAGNVNAYRDAAVRALEQTGKANAFEATEIVLTCVAGPDAVSDLPAVAVLAKSAFERGRGSLQLTALAAAHYRLGDYSRALQYSAEATKASDRATALDLAWLAMCKAKLGELAEAKSLVERAETLLSQNRASSQPGGWAHDLQARLLLNEYLTQPYEP